MNIIEYFKTIADSQNGYSFGELWKYRETSPIAVMPILKKSGISREYRLLKEAERVEITDSGMIDKVIVKNHEREPLFVRLGEVFSGKTQERMVVRSYVVMPDTVVSLDVRCIHSTRPINEGESMKTGVIVTGALERINYQALSLHQKLDQGTTWNAAKQESERISNSASSLSTCAAASSSTSTSTSTTDGGYSYENVKAHIDLFNELLRQIVDELPVIEHQVGMALHSVEKVIGLELFDHCASWDAMKKAIIYKDGANISRVDEDNVFGFSRDSVIANVKKALIADYEETVIYESEAYKILCLKSDAYLGEVTELNRQYIHLSLVNV